MNQPIRPAKSVDNVINSAIFHLSQRDHTVNELHTKLKRKTDNTEWIDATIEHCFNLGYLKPDQQFARAYCEQAFSNLRGASFIRKTLAKKGIDSQLVEQAISTAIIELNVDEAQMVAQLLSEYPSLESLSKEALASQFQRRGFSTQQLNQALADHPQAHLLKSKAQLKGAKADLERELLKRARKHKGLSVIRQELKAKHINCDGLDELVERLSLRGELDFYESCKDSLERKAMALDSHQERSKAFGYLMRRGFNGDQIKYAIEALTTAEGE